MMLKREVEKLKRSLRIPYLSVSDIYPNDDGGLRREAVAQVEENKPLAELYKLCSDIARGFGGMFENSMKADEDMVTFIISYDKYVDPPPPWNVYREDPL